MDKIIDEHFSDIEDYYIFDYDAKKNQGQTIQDGLIYLNHLVNEGEFTIL